MTGIEKILSKIQTDAKIECERIISDANNTADKILRDADNTAKQRVSKINRTAVEQCASVLNRANSFCQTQDKRISLDYKQNAVKDMISASVDYLVSLPDNEYFSLVYKLIENNLTKDNGTVYFNSADLSRLPQDFVKKLKGISKSTVSLSSIPIDIDSGFVLKYGNIDYNCSFSAIVYSKYDIISDKVSGMLFL